MMYYNYVIYLWCNAKKETLLHWDSSPSTASLQFLLNVPSPFIWILLTKIWSNIDVENARSFQVMILYQNFVHRITSYVQMLILCPSPAKLDSFFDPRKCQMAKINFREIFQKLINRDKTNN